MLVFEADLGGGQWLASDDTWSARRADAWSTDAYDAEVNQTSDGVPTESFDARKQFAGWQSPDFDDGDWGKAQVIMLKHIGGRGRSQPAAHRSVRPAPAPAHCQTGRRSSERVQCNGTVHRVADPGGGGSA